ncbi:MAG: chemotaxis protein CheW [Mariprofundus sp.]
MKQNSDAHSRLLTCCVDNQWLALPVEELSEVVTPQTRTVIPLAPNAVNGLINLRGKILTELDIRRILDLKARENETEYRTIILEGEEGEGFGLTVDAVGEVIDLKADRFERTPDSLEARWKSICHGVLKQEKGILVMLDIEKLVAKSMPSDCS